MKKHEQSNMFDKGVSFFLNNRVWIVCLFFVFLSVLILAKAAVLMLGQDRQGSGRINYCILQADNLPEKLGTIKFSSGRFMFTPAHGKTLLTDMNHSKMRLEKGEKYPLQHGTILTFGEKSYRFDIRRYDRKDQVICEARVEDFVKTGSDRPFFFAVSNGCKPGAECDNDPDNPRIRDLVMLPSNNEFLEKLKDMCGKEISRGDRLAAVLPPLSEDPDKPDRFLPNQVKGYRMKALFDDLVKILRDERVIKLDAGQTEEIKNDDILVFGNRVKIKFALERRIVSKTVELDNTEANLVAGNEEWLTNRLGYGTYIRLTRVDENLKYASKGIPAATLTPLEKIAGQNPVAISSVRTNRLVTEQDLYSLFNPAGKVANTYSDDEFLEKARNLAKETHLVSLNGVLKMKVNKDPRRKNETRVLSEQVYAWNKSVYPRSFLFWGKLPDDEEWICSDSKWRWISPDKAKASRVKIRYDMVPESVEDLPPPYIPAYWIGDSRPWQYSGEVWRNRTFTRRFSIEPGSNMGQDKLSWKIVTLAQKISATLNGKKLEVIGPDMEKSGVAARSKISVPVSFFSPGDNIFSLTLGFKPPEKVAEGNRPGLQVRFNKDGNRVKYSPSAWNTSVTGFLDWNNPKRKNHWNSARIVAQKKAAGMELSRRLMKIRPGFETVFWSERSKGSSAGGMTRYFRRSVRDLVSGSEVVLQYHASGRVSVYAGDHLLVSGSKRKGTIDLTSHISDIENNPYIYFKVDHQGGTGTVSTRHGLFEMDGNSFRGLNPEQFTYKNRYSVQKSEGEIVDTDGSSLPVLLVVKGDKKILQAGDVIPLAASEATATLNVTDILSVPENSKKYFEITRLHVSDNEAYSKNFVLVGFESEKESPLSIVNHTRRKRMPESPYTILYAPIAKRFAPEKPARFSDGPMSPVDYRGRTNIANAGQRHRLLFGREHLIYKYFENGFSRKSKRGLVYQKGRNPYAAGDIMILDRKHETMHSLLIEEYGGSMRKDSYPVPALRLVCNEKRDISVSYLGPEQNGKEISADTFQQEGGTVSLKNGDFFDFGPYTFRVQKNSKGIFSADMPGKTGKRYYPPVLGLSHTVKQGVEPLFSGLMKKGGTVSLTVDDDLQRIARNEVLRELDLIRYKNGFRIQALKEKIKRAKSVERRELLKKRLENIENMPVQGGLVILDGKGAVKACVSEPSVPADEKALKRAYKLSGNTPLENPLMNWSINGPQWAPGSSMKLLASAAALDSREESKWVADFLKTDKLAGHSRIKKNTGLPNNKKANVMLSNHNNHIMKKSCSNLECALAKSYNIYFAYLALLMDRTVMDDSTGIKGDKRFWHRAFAGEAGRFDNFSFSEKSAMAGYNRFYNLMPGPLSEDFLDFLPSEGAGYPVMVRTGRFPTDLLRNADIARTAIGQHEVRTTPLLNAAVALSIANEGLFRHPYLIEKATDKNKKVLFTAAPESNRLMSENTSQRISKAMHWVVNGNKEIYGTATGTFGDLTFADHVYGKTGTSESGQDGMEGNSWFVCYIKIPGKEQNKIFSFAAAFPNAGAGNRHAGESVKRILRRMNRYMDWGL